MNPPPSNTRIHDHTHTSYLKLRLSSAACHPMIHQPLYLGAAPDGKTNACTDTAAAAASIGRTRSRKKARMLLGGWVLPVVGWMGVAAAVGGSVSWDDWRMDTQLSDAQEEASQPPPSTSQPIRARNRSISGGFGPSGAVLSFAFAVCDPSIQPSSSWSPRVCVCGRRFEGASRFFGRNPMGACPPDCELGLLGFLCVWAESIDR